MNRSATNVPVRAFFLPYLTDNCAHVNDLTSGPLRADFAVTGRCRDGLDGYDGR